MKLVYKHVTSEYALTVRLLTVSKCKPYTNNMKDVGYGSKIQIVCNHLKLFNPPAVDLCHALMSCDVTQISAETSVHTTLYKCTGVGHHWLAMRQLVSMATPPSGPRTKLKRGHKHEGESRYHGPRPGIAPTHHLQPHQCAQIWAMSHDIGVW